jgi:hypothetical protein
MYLSLSSLFRVMSSHVYIRSEVTLLLKHAISEQPFALDTHLLPP